LSLLFISGAQLISCVKSLKSCIHFVLVGLLAGNWAIGIILIDVNYSIESPQVETFLARRNAFCRVSVEINFVGQTENNKKSC